MEELEKKQQREKIDKALEAKDFSNLTRFIIAKTFARHANMTEEEFVKDIGFENVEEDKAVRVAKINLLVEIMGQLLGLKDSVKRTHAVLKSILIDENFLEMKGEENGK